jgi:hypothetical protein
VKEKHFFILILILAVMASIAGIVVASTWSCKVADGQRGGAIADAIALWALFATRNYAADIYDALTRGSKDQIKRILTLKKSNDKTIVQTAVLQTGDVDEDEKNETELINEKIEALETRLRIEAEGQKSQNKYLAWSTVIGTIVWGFGDIVTQGILDNAKVINGIFHAVIICETAKTPM